MTPAGGAEPEHPAPVLTARGTQPVDDDAAATRRTPQRERRTPTTDMSTGAIVAIVVGVVIVLALLGFILSRTRRNMGSPYRLTARPGSSR